MKGITNDSRKVKPGYTFVATSGITVDGHDFIEEAVKKGAQRIYGERDIKDPDFEYIKVDDARQTLGDLASEFYGYPSRKLKVIGVTGTKGKTTTVHLIYHILHSMGKPVGLVSSNMAKIGDNEMDTGFHVTNPDAVSLHGLLAEMVKFGCEFAVIEVSSHGIDQKRIAGINFDIGVLTNIAPEHLDYHKNFEEYKSVKMSFVRSCKHQVIAPSTTRLNILPGKFNNLNLEAALEVVELLGINRNEALETINSFELPEGRLAEIQNKKGVKIFIDFAHTPESIYEVLSYLRGLTKGKLITVFGSAGERDPFKRPRMGDSASRVADILILTSEDPRTEDPIKIISEIKSGIKNQDVEVYEISDRSKAIKKSLNLAKPGDLVAILGKGHEKSMNMDGVHEEPWSDTEEVLKNL